MLGRRMPQGYLDPPPAILGTTLLGRQPGDPTWGPAPAEGSQKQGRDRGWGPGRTELQAPPAQGKLMQQRNLTQKGLENTHGDATAA